MLEIREGGGNHDFSSKLFCVRAPKLFVDDPFCAVFQNNSVSEKFMDNWVRGRKKEVSKFSVESLLSHSAGKIRRGTLLRFRKIRVRKIVRDKRGSGKNNFPSKWFCSKLPNQFVEEHFCVSQTFWY